MDEGVCGNVRHMLQLSQLDLGQPVRYGKVGGHDAKKCPAAGKNGGGLHAPDACTAYHRPARRELLVSHDVLDDNRMAISQGSCTRRPVLNPHSFKKSQKSFIESLLCLDLKTAGLPVHELDIAKASLAEVNASLQEPIEYRLNVSKSSARDGHRVRHVTSQGNPIQRNIVCGPIERKANRMVAPIAIRRG